MQTFLPYASFRDSARSLDYRRLGKQRVETYQILKALRGESKGWTNHPATKMWRGYEYQLCGYGAVMSIEWMRLGYKDSLLEKFIEIAMDYKNVEPWWLGMPELHISHKSNLYRKDPEFYADFAIFGSDRPYVWPVQ